jgi:hypothetical protein
MKLAIAIPALNEEESIEAIIRRCLAAREYIRSQSPVTEVEVTVVSDGSTDRTVELARPFEGQVRLIVFPENRGYGAAILAAWRGSEADLLGFLDADGTCDPRFFADLCRLAAGEGADVVLGNRMTRGSHMPLLRRLGNALFGALLSLFSSQRVRDTASGMRVVRRESLGKLLPLPSGLHFTPAMSARALLRSDVVIREIPMPYAERAGRSKLKPWRDGLRFLRTILDATLLYRPSRPLSLAGLACLTAAVLLMIPPALHYLRSRTVEEWMIYRFVVGHLLGTTAVLALSGAYLGRRIVSLSGLPAARAHRGERLARRFFSSRWFWAVPALLAAAGLALVLPSLSELVVTGATYEHWSRFIVMSSLLSTAAVLAVTWLLHRALDLLAAQQEFRARQGAAPSV